MSLEDSRKIAAKPSSCQVYFTKSMDPAQASNALSCSVLRVHASLSTSATHALVVSFGAGVFDVSNQRMMRNNASAMYVIPADDAAKRISRRAASSREGR